MTTFDVTKCEDCPMINEDNEWCEYSQAHIYHENAIQDDCRIVREHDHEIFVRIATK